MRYSTGCVRDYIANGCGGPDLPLTIPEGANIRFWYNLGGFQLFTRWENGDVWGSDFRDGPDLAADGGSDVPELYFFAGHGACENPPSATSGDFIIVCGNFGKPDVTNLGASSRWGNNGGHLRFAIIDASCPMDLVELSNSWFPCFRGLHMAVGFSGTSNQDALDSANRGGQFAAYTAGTSFPFGLIPNLSVGDAWMRAGLIDIQNGCCAVALAAGNDRNDAIDRRENEKVTDNRSNPTPNWFAWKWICR
jgi:Family of unknown function (DUF6345)